MTDHGGAASPRTLNPKVAGRREPQFASGRSDTIYAIEVDTPDGSRWEQVWVLRNEALAHRIVAALAAQEAPAPEGLRAALDAVYAFWQGRPDLAPGVRLRDQVRVALAATPPTPAEPPRCPTCGRTEKHAHYSDDPALRAEARPPEGLAPLLLEGVEAFRLTREYVGEDALPALPGWSWFDWCEKVAARLSAGGATKP
jgi:hypothetical protein